MVGLNDPDSIERWQGQIDARLSEVEKKTDTFLLLTEAITGLRVEIATLRAQMKFWSAMGGAGMTGVVSLLVALLIKG